MSSHAHLIRHPVRLDLFPQSTKVLALSPFLFLDVYVSLILSSKKPIESIVVTGEIRDLRDARGRRRSVRQAGEDVHAKSDRKIEFRAAPSSRLSSAAIIHHDEPGPSYQR